MCSAMISPVFLLMIMVCVPCIRAITGLFLWARPMPRWVSFPWYLRVMVPLWSTVSSRTRQNENFLELRISMNKSSNTPMLKLKVMCICKAQKDLKMLYINAVQQKC